MAQRRHRSARGHDLELVWPGRQAVVTDKQRQPVGTSRDDRRVRNAVFHDRPGSVSGAVHRLEVVTVVKRAPHEPHDRAVGWASEIRSAEHPHPAWNEAAFPTVILVVNQPADRIATDTVKKTHRVGCDI